MRLGYADARSLACIFTLRPHSVRHVVYVELPALATWPDMRADGDTNAAQHPFLSNVLPALNVARTADTYITERSTPFVIDTDVRTCLPLVRALLEGGLEKIYEAVAPVSVVPYSAIEEMALESGDLFAGMRATLDQLWATTHCRCIPPTKLARRRFISLLAERVYLLQEFRRSIQRMRADQMPRNSLFEPFTGGLRGVVWDRLARILFLECIYLCCIDEGVVDPPTLPIWCVRDKKCAKIALIVRR